MNKTKQYQSGQALILIVFAIIGLIGMTALTVDGSNAFSDRRHAQNAADTAVLAAARAKIRGENWKGAALNIADANSYADTDHTANSSSPSVNVEVYQCNESGVDCNITPKPGDALADYLQVRITSTIPTYFGGVIGVWDVTNRVNSVARVKAGSRQPVGNGNAIYALSDECSAVMYGGNAAVNLIGSGIYINSSCPQSAFFNNSTSPGLTAPCLQAVGGITYKEGSIHIPSECILTGQQPLEYPILPDPTPSCDTDAVRTSNTLSPGNWSGTFPPSGVTNLQSGIYCVNSGDFRLNAGDVLIGQNVMIYMKTGGVTWNGQATIRLDAPDYDPYKGLLIYLPPANSSAVGINGGGQSKIVGTILAPSSECSVLGGGGQDGLQTQLICSKVKLGGGSNTTIVYNSDLQYKPWHHPQMELTK